MRLLSLLIAQKPPPLRGSGPGVTGATGPGVSGATGPGVTVATGPGVVG